MANMLALSLNLMDNPGERIRELRLKMGLTQKQLAKQVGVSQPTVANWEKSGHTLVADNLVRVAEVLRTSASYLMGRGESKFTTHRPDELSSQLLDWDSDTPLEEDEVEIRFMTGVEIAAGDGVSEVSEYNGPKLRFSRSSMRKFGVTAPENAVCAVTNGRSMADKIGDGAVIGVDTGFTKIIDGKIYVINDDGDLRIKYLYKLRKGGISLRSHNKDEYPDDNHEAGWEAYLRIVGRVFWWSSVDSV